MLCYAYRRTPIVLEPEADEDSIWPLVYMARLDTDTGMFQLLGDQGQPVAPPVDWTHRNRRTADQTALYSWVNQYSQLWSIRLEDAFWFDTDLSVDEGL